MRIYTILYGTLYIGIDYKGVYRSSSTKQELKGAILSRFLMQKTGLSWDSVPVANTDIETFHHNPEKWITGSWIKIGYFKDDATILYQYEVHGSLMQQNQSLQGQNADCQ